MSAFGIEMRQLIKDLAGEEFASSFEYQHITSVENPTTFAVEQTIVTANYKGAFSEPSSVKLFSKETLSQVETVVVMPVEQFASLKPSIFDKVQVEAGKFLRVIAVSEYILPGGGSLPLSGGYALALAS